MGAALCTLPRAAAAARLEPRAQPPSRPLRAATVARLSPPPSRPLCAAAARLAPRARPPSRRLCAAAAAAPPKRRQLVLYTKPGCCLCEGLKEKLQAAFLLAGTPHSLAAVELQERDITTNPEWERRYQYEIPVLAKVLPDGSEETLPRLSPRLSVELIQKKISAAFDQ